MREEITQRCLSHFLCAFDPKSKKRKTMEVVREIALQYYAKEKVDEYLESDFDHFQELLVEEFNTRYDKRWPLRFQLSDETGIGAWVQGYSPPKQRKEVRFQDALQRINPGEFEKLAAIILRLLGCRQVFLTPQSHDQGVDAFGYQEVVLPMPYGMTHNLTWIAQAKHYLASGVSTGDVRDLVGSKELMVARVFSTVNERYKQLDLRPYGPTAIALITTEEIPASVRRLAERAGVFVFAASDLFHILSPKLRMNSSTGIRTMLSAEGKSIPTLT